MDKMKNLMIVVLMLNECISLGQNPYTFLFPIYENDKTGFMNAKGENVIPPIYHSAGEFSEGLAAARLNGTYGYINSTGAFIIPPSFDYATPFREGIAIVFKDGKQLFINKKGKEPFPFKFHKATPFKDGFSQVITLSNKIGIINKLGKLVVDTNYKFIDEFVDGFAVVTGINHREWEDEEKNLPKKIEIGVIDTTGKFIIPYGKYDKISPLSNNCFRVSTISSDLDSLFEYGPTDLFINKKGDPILTLNLGVTSWLLGDFQCGLVRASLYSPQEKKKKEKYRSINCSYEGYLNEEGEIVINDTNIKTGYDFYNNRAVVRDKNYKKYIIDRTGKTISIKYDAIIGNRFFNGIAIVQSNGEYGLIDTNANYIISPRYNGIAACGIVDGYFFFQKKNITQKNGAEMLYGIAKLDGTVVLAPTLEDFNSEGFIHGTLGCTIDHKFTYINETGKIIWQEKLPKKKELSNLNIDFMNRGYFVAHANIKSSHGGQARNTKSLPQPITSTTSIPNNQLSILVNTENKERIFQDYNGVSVFVSNNTKDTIRFNTQDHRLYMKVQAQNKNGEWQDIEFLPNSWCGNSYYSLPLLPNHFWAFKTPVYEGDFKTKLRIELKYIDPLDKSEERFKEKKELIIYSNEYDGSVNPGQFWRKRGYTPSGFMDPYNE
jgi:WG containing repeat